MRLLKCELRGSKLWDPMVDDSNDPPSTRERAWREDILFAWEDKSCLVLGTPTGHSLLFSNVQDYHTWRYFPDKEDPYQWCYDNSYFWAHDVPGPLRRAVLMLRGLRPE